MSEVTRCEGELFGPAGRLRRRERERIWAGILERVNAVSRVPRTLREVKKRWDDLKRRNGGRLADARHRSCYLPSTRASAVLGGPPQLSPRFHQGRQKLSTRGKASFTCLSDTDPGEKGWQLGLAFFFLFFFLLHIACMSFLFFLWYTSTGYSTYYYVIVMQVIALYLILPLFIG